MGCKGKSWGVIVSCVMLLGATWQADAITTNITGAFRFSFYNSGETDGGINLGTQDWTAEQMNDMAMASQTWTDTIGNTPGRLVDVHCFWTNFPGAKLGGSSSPFLGDYTRAWTLTEYVWREGANYTRSTNTYADMTIVYDTDAAGYAWNFGADTPTSYEIDFRSVVTHEIGHGMGFVSSYSSSTDKWWLGGITAWDSWLRDDAGNAPLANSSGTPGNFNQLDNPVWFTGPNAMAANGGTSVPVFAPATWTAGSSLSHLDYSTYPNALMNPYTSLGAIHRTITAVEEGVLLDLGWNVIPEPGTLALLAIAFGGTYAARRLRRIVHNPPIRRA